MLDNWLVEPYKLTLSFIFALASMRNAAVGFAKLLRSLAHKPLYKAPSKANLQNRLCCENSKDEVNSRLF